MKKTITFFKRSIGSTSFLHASNPKLGISLRLFVFLATFLVLTVQFAFGQITEGFETGMPDSFTGVAATSVTASDQGTATALGSGSWKLGDVKRESTYKHGGLYSAQIHSVTGACLSTPVITNGVGTVTFWIAASSISSAGVQLQISTDGGTTYTQVGSTYSTYAAIHTFYQQSATINQTGSNIRLRWYRTAATIYIDDISITSYATPTLTAASPASLSGFSTTEGTASLAKTFTVGGSNLTASLVVTAPTDYEVRENGIGSFGSSVSFTPSTGTVATKTIEVRIAASAPVGTPAGNVVCSSTGATSQNVAVNGTVNSASSPVITIDGVINAFANTVINGTSAKQSYTLQGANLTGDVTVTPPAGFEISKSSGSGFVANPSTLTFTSVEIASAQNVYVRFAPTAAQAYSGNITHISNGATQVDKAVSGTGVYAEPTDHPAGLTAITNSSSQITVTWTDATGGQVPASYLVIASTGTPTTPVDGTVQADGTQLNGEIVKNITQTTQTAVFTGLSASTTYNFSIWPYTNSGAAIDYKTDGAIATSATTETPLGVPVAAAATNVTPTSFTANWGGAARATGYDVNVYTKTAVVNATDLFISEYGEGTSSNKYIEIYNGTGAEVDLSQYTLKSAYNGQGWDKDITYTLPLSGTLVNNDVYVIVNSAADARILAQADLSFTSSETAQGGRILTFSGNDAIGLFKNGLLIDIFGDPTSVTDFTVAGYSTWASNHTLVRKSYVVSPTTDWALSAGTTESTSQWDGFVSNTWTSLGSHTMAGGSTSTPISGSPFTVTETSKVVSGLNPGTEYFYTVVSKNASGSSAASNEISVTTPKITFTGTGEWTETARWNTGTVPGITAQVVVDGAATINSDVEVAGLTINAGKSLTVNPAKQLTISGTATNNGTITIQSDANGTGTIVGDVSGNATVNQYLKGDYRTWYLSSPVANAQPANLGWIKYYNEADGGWPTLFDARTSSLVAYGSNSFVTAKGYLVVPSTSAVANANIQFAGELNTGNKSIALTNSATNTSKPGFNLVGNPYPSYLKWADVYATNESKLSSASIWYRTKQLNEYVFWTVNGHGVVSPQGVSASSNIPPMQAFWVKTTAGGGTLELTNNMRSHANATGFLLKAPAVDTRTLIRLQVSNGTNTDEAVLYLSDNANNGLDAFDAPKMTNDNASIAEIFTRAGNEKLVINAMRTLPRDTEIALGFEAGSAASFTLRANELSNLPSDVKLILKDNVTKAETDLTDGTAVYSFSNIATSGDRFSIIFRTAGAVTGIDQPTFSGLTAYSNANNQLTVLYDGVIDAHTVVSVYNAVGQRLVTQSLKGVSTIVDGAFVPGVYVVKVNNLSRKLTIKN